MVLSVCVNSQTLVVFEEWTNTDGVQNMFIESFSITDVNRNVYVGGATFNAQGNYDILLSKYDSHGVLLWSEVYAGAGNGDDGAVAICFGNSGEIYLTGSVYTGSTNKNDCILLKYEDDGDLEWAETYNGGASDMDFGTDLIVDGSGFIYISGASTETNTYYDFLVLKYDHYGTLQWDNTWDDSGLFDIPNKLRLTDGKVVLAGGAQINATKWEYAVVGFSQSTGAFSGENVSNTTNNGIDQIFDLTVDADDNIYITGGIEKVNTGYDIRTAKLDSTLSVQWVATYNYSDSLNDKGKAVAVDGYGNVYVSGYVSTDEQGEDIITIKYNSSGTQQWAYLYNGNEDGDDGGADLVIDSNGNVITTGYTYNGSNFDYFTQKIDSSGDLIWEIDYNGLLNKDDKA